MHADSVEMTPDAAAAARPGRVRRGGLFPVLAAATAAMLLATVVPRARAPGAIALRRQRGHREGARMAAHNDAAISGNGAPFVLGGGSNSVLRALAYERAHSAVRRRRGSRGRSTVVHPSRSRRPRAQQLSEISADDPEFGRYEWKGQGGPEENTFDTDEFDSTPHEWKGQGGPEENAFDTDEFDSTPHEWKGQGGPEENVFENWEKEGSAGMQAQAKQAALADEAAKGARGARQVALARVYAKAEEHAKQRDQERGEQERQLEAKLVKRDKQLASVTKELIAEKRRVAHVEKEAQGHIWRRQHSPVNVLKTVYPDLKWKWSKQDAESHLPSSVFDNLKSTPVLWHKYRAKKSHVLDFLSTKPVKWHTVRTSYNALSGLPVDQHKWHAQPGEVNVLNSLPSDSHQWRRYEGEDNVLASLPSEAHAWQPQKQDKNVLASLPSDKHVWKRGRGVAEEQGQNVLDALSSSPYKWKKGNYNPPANVLENLPDHTHQWHAATPDKSPLDALPERTYTWRGPGPPSLNPLAQLDDSHYHWKGPGAPDSSPLNDLPDDSHKWQGYKPDTSPLSELPDHEYTWKVRSHVYFALAGVLIAGGSFL